MLRQLSPQLGRRTGLEEVTKRKPRDLNRSDSPTTSLWVGSRSMMTMFSSSKAALNSRHLVTKHHVVRARKEGSLLPQSLAVSELEFQSPNMPRSCSPLVPRKARERDSTACDHLG